MTTYTPWQRIEATDEEIAANVPTHHKLVLGIRVRRSQFDRARDHEDFVTRKSNIIYIRENFQPGISFTYLGCKGRVLSICSACGPVKHRDGTPTEYGKWHGQFERVFLPLGMFETNRVGNLAHKETGDDNVRAYALVEPDKQP